MKETNKGRHKGNEGSSPEKVEGMRESEEEKERERQGRKKNEYEGMERKKKERRV